MQRRPHLQDVLPAVAEVRGRLELVSKRIPPRVLRGGLGLGAAAFIIVVVLHSRSSFSLGHIAHPDPGWLTLAILAEVGALSAYALIVRKLLALGSVQARLRALLRATVGGIAMSASLPGGQAASAADWYQQLRREGADGPLAALAMVGSMLAGVLSLAGLLVAGVAIAGDRGPLADAHTPILAATAALLVAGWILRRRVRRAPARLIPARARSLSVSAGDVGAIGALAYTNWLFDVVCLYAALAAVHATVPLHSILLTFAIAQLVASLPLLPGGGGTVELTLALGFAAFGQTSAAVIAGILLFRLVSCWGLVPVGWLAVALEGRRLPAWSLRRAAAPTPLPAG